MGALPADEPEPGLKFDRIYEVYSQRFKREDFDDDEEAFDPRLLPEVYLLRPSLRHALVYVRTIQRMRINLFGQPEDAPWGDWDDKPYADVLDMTVEQMAEVRLGRQRSPAWATGPNMVPYVRAANVTWRGLDLSDIKQMDFSSEEQIAYRLHPGNVLLSEASGSVSEVGKPALWNDEIPGCWFQNALIRVRPNGALSRYLYYHFLYDASQDISGASRKESKSTILVLRG